MTETGIKPFLCDSIEKAVLRSEWSKWVRSFQLYCDSEDITDVIKKRNKLLHLGGPQLQEVAYNIPGALEEYDPTIKNDVFKVLVDKLNCHFSPEQNSTFERHLFRSLKPGVGENLNKFLVRIRQQASKCVLGNTTQEATEINIKDKLIDDWAPIELKKKLLEKEHSLTEVINLCQVHEQISTQAHLLNQNTVEPIPSLSATSSQINSIRDRNSQECGRCGKRNHKAKDLSCPARNFKCHRCGMTGHFISRCRTKMPKPPVGGSGQYSKKRRMNTSVRYVESLGHDSDEEQTGMQKFDCFQIKATTLAEHAFMRNLRIWSTY